MGVFTRRVFRCYLLSAQGSRGMHWGKRGYGDPWKNLDDFITFRVYSCLYRLEGARISANEAPGSSLIKSCHRNPI